MSGEALLTESGEELLTEDSFPLFTEGRLVIIAPTDDVTDVNAMGQSITAEAADEITFTAVQGALSAGTNLYLFVVSEAGDSNASGFIVQFTAGGRVQIIFARQGIHRASSF